MENSAIISIIIAALAGLSIPLGGYISSNLTLRAVWLRHEVDSIVLYFSGGALLAAIALILIPHGMENTSVISATLAFLAGSVIFWLLDSYLKKTGTAMSYFFAMMLDYLPESIAVGAAAATGQNTVYLLALLIALQNMPEGFASYEELHENDMSTRKIWFLFSASPFAGAVAAWFGYTFLARSTTVMGLLLLFCSGAIMYLIFEDIAPKAHDKRHSFTALGAILGFLFGLVGTMLIH